MYYKSVYESFDDEIKQLRESQRQKELQIELLFKKQKTGYSDNFTRAFKEKIKKRDNYTCQYPQCFVKGKGNDLVVHHITYSKKATHKDLCVTLCRGHNITVNSNKEYWHDYFRNRLHFMLNR